MSTRIISPQFLFLYMSQATEAFLTPEKFEELKKELEYLKTTRRKEIAESLEYARSLGDLSENADSCSFSPKGKPYMPAFSSGFARPYTLRLLWGLIFSFLLPRLPNCIVADESLVVGRFLTGRQIPRMSIWDLGLVLLLRAHHSPLAKIAGLPLQQFCS